MNLQFESWLQGPLAELRGCIQFGESSDPPQIQHLALSALAGHSPEFIAAAQQFFSGQDEKALLSQWSKVCFRYLIAPATIAAVIGRQRLMLTADAKLRLKQGVPVGLCLPVDALKPDEGEPLSAYQPLFDTLQLTISQLSGSVRLSPKVLWSNAGTLLELLLQLLQQSAEHAALAQSHARLLLDSTELFGKRNPLKQPVSYLHPHSPQLPDPMRTRRLCCLRYLLPDEAWCASCPRLLQLDETELSYQLARMHGAD